MRVCVCVPVWEDESLKPLIKCNCPANVSVCGRMGSVFVCVLDGWEGAGGGAKCYLNLAFIWTRMGSGEVTFLTVWKCGAVVILPICRFYSFAKDGYLLNGLRASAATESCVVIDPRKRLWGLISFFFSFQQNSIQEIYM